MPKPKRAPSPVSPVLEQRRPGIPLPQGWKQAYLDALRAEGGFYRAARTVGVDYDTALAERDRDPAFDKQCQSARQEYADNLECQMVEDSHLSGNPAGQIVRLKALRPAEYIEKHAMLSLTANLNDLPIDDATLLLKQLLGATTDATRQALSNGDGTTRDVRNELQP